MVRSGKSDKTEQVAGHVNKTVSRSGSFRHYTKLGDDRDLKSFDQRAILVIGGTIFSILLLFAETFVHSDSLNSLFALMQCILIYQIKQKKELRMVLKRSAQWRHHSKAN